MKYTRRITFLLPFLFSLNTAIAQSPFVFDKTEHNFGEIYETSGVATARFHFTNTGDKPLFISEVNVSCGCTQPEYKKDTLQPGEKGYITAKYDPTGRPGSFDKTIHVVFNNNRGFFTHLRIKGTVIAVTKPGKQTYTVLYGNTSFNTTTFDFGEIKQDKEYTAVVKVANDGLNLVKIMAIQDLPKEFKLEYPQELKPGDSAVLCLTVHKNDIKHLWGDFSYRLVLTTTDHLMAIKVLHIKGKTVQDFSHLSKAELAQAPVIKVSSTSVQFGELKKGGTKSQTVTITNTGKSELEIRNIHAGCYCFRGEVDKKTIPPGETATLTLTFDSIGQRDGKLNRGVTIYSNDPKNSEIIVYGTVEII